MLNNEIFKSVKRTTKDIQFLYPYISFKEKVEKVIEWANDNDENKKEVI